MRHAIDAAERLLPDMHPFVAIEPLATACGKLRHWLEDLATAPEPQDHRGGPVALESARIDDDVFGRHRDVVEERQPARPVKVSVRAALAFPLPLPLRFNADG